MDVDVVFDVTTDSYEIEIESNTIVVNEKDTALTEVGHNHDERYYTKDEVDDKLVEQFVAGEVLNGHRFIYINNGKAYKAANNNYDCYNKVIGMTLNAALEDELVNVRQSGKVTQAGWGLVPNTLYYLGLDGLMTPYEDADGLGLCVGYSISENDFIINIREDIIYGY